MEVRDTSSYESILRLVANGVNQNSKLSDKSGFSTSLTSAILSNLEKLEIVKTKHLFLPIKENLITLSRTLFLTSITSLSLILIPC